MFLIVLSWILTVSLLLGGFAGCFLPMLPGTPLILAGAISYEWLLAKSGHELGWGTLVGLSAIMVVSHIVDFIAAIVGANRFGASKMGIWGGVLGLFVGMFFSLPGLLLGPVLGVFLGELASGKEPHPAFRAAWGTIVGNAAGVAFRVIAGAAMVVWFILAARN